MSKTAHCWWIYRRFASGQVLEKKNCSHFQSLSLSLNQRPDDIIERPLKGKIFSARSFFNITRAERTRMQHCIVIESKFITRLISVWANLSALAVLSKFIWFGSFEHFSQWRQLCQQGGWIIEQVLSSVLCSWSWQDSCSSKYEKTHPTLHWWDVFHCNVLN